MEGRIRGRVAVCVSFLVLAVACTAPARRAANGEGGPLIYYKIP